RPAPGAGPRVAGARLPRGRGAGPRRAARAARPPAGRAADPAGARARDARRGRRLEPGPLGHRGDRRAGGLRARARAPVGASGRRSSPTGHASAAPARGSRPALLAPAVAPHHPETEPDDGPQQRRGQGELPDRHREVPPEEAHLHVGGVLRHEDDERRHPDARRDGAAAHPQPTASPVAAGRAVLSAQVHGAPPWTPAAASGGTSGRRRAATSPISPAIPSATMARPYDRSVRFATRIVPATAVPSDEPRLDTLRDTPEISPWRSSGKLDC